MDVKLYCIPLEEKSVLGDIWVGIATRGQRREKSVNIRRLCDPPGAETLKGDIILMGDGGVN